MSGGIVNAAKVSSITVVWPDGDKDELPIDLADGDRLVDVSGAVAAIAGGVRFLIENQHSATVLLNCRLLENP